MHHRRHTREGERPRNVDWRGAAALLYGDWGTSNAYVIGLAFAVCGYSAPWPIAVMSLVTALVGYNYLTICRLYPSEVVSTRVYGTDPSRPLFRESRH